MKIKPIGGKIQIQFEEPKAGALETSSLNVAKERGKIIAVGDLIKEDWVGKDIFFKAWAVDIINDEGKKYYFIDYDSKGICAIVK